MIKKRIRLSICAIILLSLMPDVIYAQSSPMGKTLAVFIENSNYGDLPDLAGPSRDAVLIRDALSNYQIDSFIHKQNMTKFQMEDFFSSELPVLLSTNTVKSLLLWYAGHGDYVDVGYWIPVDAKNNDASSYVDIPYIKNEMKNYTGLTHILVINDAKGSAMSFIKATRRAPVELDCDDTTAYISPSAQILSSTGREPAADDSYFAQSFTKNLLNNKQLCITIESVVSNMMMTFRNRDQQKPIFGKIGNLPHENGTFFFFRR